MDEVQASTSPQDIDAHLGAAAAPVRIDVRHLPTFAISPGLSANFPNDHAMLAHGTTIYDALYAWCRGLQAETHDWPAVQVAPTQ